MIGPSVTMLAILLGLAASMFIVSGAAGPLFFAVGVWFGRSIF